MPHQFLIYGANGYTGRLIARAAVERGLRPTLAGRDANKTKALAADLGLNWISFDLTDGKAMDAALRDLVLVLNCAGPFARTAAPMIEGCIRTSTHYLDVTGEIDVLEQAAQRSDAALKANIMLLPGCGFDVVPSDCLAMHVAARLPDAGALRLSISSPGALSRGTMNTAAAQIAQGRGGPPAHSGSSPVICGWVRTLMPVPIDDAAWRR